MLVFVVKLVFYKVLTLLYFTNIVIVAAYTCKKGICTNFAAGTFGKLRNHNGMIVSTICLNLHLFENGTVCIT